MTSSQAGNIIMYTIGRIAIFVFGTSRALSELERAVIYGVRMYIRELLAGT